MKKHYYSNGKLLLTGEYVVLDGAKAFAFPTKFGQDLTIMPASDKKISWKSFNHDGAVWFEDKYEFDEICTPDYVEKYDSVKTTLLEILHEGYLKNPDFINNANGYAIETRLTFPKNWGLGTSSTLINNIAQWLSIDAFELLQNSFGGSGYDIACAQNDTAVEYQLENGLPKITPILFAPDFGDQLYFVYLNKKQSSKAAIASYYHNRTDGIGRITSKISKITEAVIAAKDVRTFAHELERHESIMSDVLEMRTVKEALFPDFNGVIKSLGAWGGDFVLAVSRENPTRYFEERGYDTVLPFSEMIL
ncbi:GYDIA family GHMP kinase [Flavobacterium selenitireducens]|uniref:GYDIA family GHMP kinase n=1 Tax=Flavobacterium selenitireducens TaxID=2722704 RepID=UPI00168BACE8|nr:GYDIA family GHMP kinase [Flavobacterium selenitireducens]MBD3583134.1 GHMP kinase [Flavobacterium selenitireducens]